MNFDSNEKYIDVCIEYALSYTKDELSHAFSKVVARISSRHPSSNSRPIDVAFPFNEVLATPTNIRDGLLFFFRNRLTNTWPSRSFREYYSDVKREMVSCYVPFRDFNEEDFQDSMRLRVYQDSLNILAGRKIDISSNKKFSTFNKLRYSLQNKIKPQLL